MSVGVSRRFGAVGFVALVAVVALVFSGCGSSGSSDSSGSTTSTAGASNASAKVPDVVYDGPDKAFPKTYSAPAIKPGFKFTVGFISYGDSIDAFRAGRQVAQAEAERLGGKFVFKDGQLDPQKQVSEFDELLAQKVDAIIMYPVDPSGFGPSLAKAKAQGVPVFGMDTPVDSSDPPAAGYTSTVLYGRDIATYLVAKAGAEAHPGGTFSILGSAAPAASTHYQYIRFEYWAKKFGLKFDGRVDGPTTSPEDIARGMQSLLSRYPKVDLVFLGNDPMAVAAAAQARAQGNTHVMTSGLSATKEALADIKAGSMFATYRTQMENIHKESVWSVYHYLTKQHLPLPKRILVSGPVVTKANVDQITPVTPK